MPKFGTHFIIAEEAKKKRPDQFPFGPRFDNAFRLGAVGPDTTLFLFDPAVKSKEFRDGIDTALKVLKVVHDVKDRVDDVVEELTGPIENLADWVTGGLYSALRYTMNTALEALFLSLKLGTAGVTQVMNLKNPVFTQLQDLPGDFIDNPLHAAKYWSIGIVDNVGYPLRTFGHPYTSDGAWRKPEPTGDYRKWWWMDLLHYRRTGQFASSLLRGAEGSELLTAYARGYMTHFAGDVCGHPFINTLVGGPYRNHAYRHLVVETLADTWLWRHMQRGDIIGAQFDALIDVPDSDLGQIANLVVSSMREVYQAPMVPTHLEQGYPTPDEWAGAYRLMREYLRLATNPGVRRPPVPPDSPSEIIKELQDRLKRNMPGPFPSPGTSIEVFLKALLGWFSKGVALIAMLVTAPIAFVVELAATAPRWLIYVINLALYMIVSSLRSTLCLMGWGYCSVDDFENFTFLEKFVTVSDGAAESYPKQTVPNPKLPFYWLVSPNGLIPAPLEGRATIPMTPHNQGLTPFWMIDPANRMDLPRLLEFINSKSPEETRGFEAAVGPSVFGNAIDLAIGLLDHSVPMADFDLDGDRGFGYLGWEELPPNERYFVRKGSGNV